MTQKTANKYRLIPLPQNYTDLTDKRTISRLTNDIKQMVTTINENRTVQTIPDPTNLNGSFGAGYAAIYWDDVEDKYRRSLDGARIWRVKSSDNAETNFYKNDSREMLVSCIRTTRYVDVEVEAVEYIYWVQWVNLDGTMSGIAGGVKGTVT